MLRFRARGAAAVVLAAAFALTLRGRAQDAPPSLQISDVGLPAVQELGAVWNESRTPWRPASVSARAVASQSLRVGVSGRAYQTGKVIVRFRDEITADERRGLVRDASSTGEM